MNLLILDLMLGLCNRSFSTRIAIHPSRPENNINLHFETDVKEKFSITKIRNSNSDPSEISGSSLPELIIFYIKYCHL